MSLAFNPQNPLVSAEKSPRLITQAVTSPQRLGLRIEIRADRHVLAKRRWLGRAADGAEFGFDLTAPLRHLDVVFETELAYYSVQQTPEPVLEMVLGAAPDAARLGWTLGNLHFQVEVDRGVLRVVDDLAIRQALERDFIPYTPVIKLFQPLKAETHGHGPSRLSPSLAHDLGGSAPHHHDSSCSSSHSHPHEHA